MADVVATFYPTAAKSGYIKKTDPATYVVHTNTDGFCGWDYSGASWVENRAFFSYDTSSIGSGAIITGVRWRLGYYGLLASNGPDNWRNVIRMGTWIGSSLDSSDWGGGLITLPNDWPGAPGAPVAGWLTIPSAKYSLINTSGDTDLVLRDNSQESSPWGAFHIVCRTITGRPLVKCRLEVTYTPGDDQDIYYNFGG